MKRLLLFCVLFIPSIVQASNGVTIIAYGSGFDERTAQEDAYRNAAEKTYETFVSSNSTIPEDKLMSDDIFRPENGVFDYSRSSLLTETPFSNGYRYIIMKVYVDIDQLVNYVTDRTYSLDEETEEEDVQIFTVVENDPEFPGGRESLYKYLCDNIKLPQLARDNNITGKVYVTFVVERDGSISNPRILRDIGGGCGAEAVRVIKSMPKWIPGKQRGKPVRVQFNLPVSFNLQ